MTTATRTARTYTAVSTTGPRWDVLGFGPTRAAAEAMAEAAIVARVGESGIYAETYRKNLRVVGRTTASDRYHAFGRNDFLGACPTHGAYAYDVLGNAGDACPFCAEEN